MLLSNEVKRNESWAFDFFRQAAEQGHVPAAEAMGLCYRWGTGVRSDVEQAMHWLKKAAEGGNPDASWTLGCMFREGEGTPKDASAAVRWYTEAADGGHKSAAEELGVMYLMGEGVPVDEEGSAYWFAVSSKIEKMQQEAADPDAWMYEYDEVVEDVFNKRRKQGEDVMDHVSDEEKQMWIESQGRR